MHRNISRARHQRPSGRARRNSANNRPAATNPPPRQIEEYRVNPPARSRLFSSLLGLNSEHPLRAVAFCLGAMAGSTLYRGLRQSLQVQNTYERMLSENSTGTRNFTMEQSNRFIVSSALDAFATAYIGVSILYFAVNLFFFTHRRQGYVVTIGQSAEDFDTTLNLEGIPDNRAQHAALSAKIANFRIDNLSSAQVGLIQTARNELTALEENDRYICPITAELLRYPVTMSMNGNDNKKITSTYSYENIKKWIEVEKSKNQSHKDPYTRLPYQNKKFSIDHSLQSEITQAFKDIDNLLVQASAAQD